MPFTTLATRLRPTVVLMRPMTLTLSSSISVPWPHAGSCLQQRGHARGPATFSAAHASHQSRTLPRAIADTLAVPSSPPVALPLWRRLGPVTRAAEAYGRVQRRRPWATQVAVAVVVYFAADLSAQTLAGGSKSGDGDGDGEGGYDVWRALRSVTIGAGAAIPAFCWFVHLARSFNFASRVLSIATKVAVNQLLWVPLFNVYFFGMHALLSGDSPAQAVEHIRRTVPTSFVNSCKLWPAVTAFNLTFVPLEYRSIVGGLVGIVWQTYLALLNSEAEMDEKWQADTKPTADNKKLSHTSLNQSILASSIAAPARQFFKTAVAALTGPEWHLVSA